MKIQYASKRKIFWAELDGSADGSKEERDVYWGQKDVVKEAGFRFDRDGKATGTSNTWYTKFTDAAERLAQYCVGEAKEKVSALTAKREDSRSLDADIDVPSPEGLEYLPFQRGGINYMIKQDRTLLGDDMGLGKTIEVLGLINASADIKNVLVVCPATVRINWMREAAKWLCSPRKFVLHRVTGNQPVPSNVNFVVVGWSNLSQKKVRASLMLRTWDLAVFDEAHYAKNVRGAQRAQAALGKYDREKGKGEVLIQDGIVHRSRKVVFATGTPIVNRPIELFPMLRALDPEGLGRSFFGFAKRYCGAYDNGYGWDFSGASNLGELQNRLRSTCMIRRTKAEVMTELPEKRRTVVTVDANGSSALMRREKKLLDSIPGFREAVEEGDYASAVKMLQGDPEAFEEISLIRHEIGLAKVDKVIEFAKDALDNERKIIVYAHHRDVQDKLAEALSDYGVVRVMGGYSDVKKQASVDAFQGNDNVRVLVGSLEACREGLNLTASSAVIFAELPWTPSAVTQAEDRAHRYGQKNAVNVYHLVIENSLDAYMAQTIVEKQENMDAALDDKVETKTLVAPELQPVITATQIPTKDVPITAEQVQDSYDKLMRVIDIVDADLEKPPF